MAEWINVKDRLPEENGYYLCYSGRNMYVCRFAKKLSDVDDYDFYGDDGFGFYGYDSEYGYFEYNEVTHWMPLPKPPKGDSNG